MITKAQAAAIEAARAAMLTADTHAGICDVYRPVYHEVKKSKDAQRALKAAYDEAWYRVRAFLPDDELTTSDREARDAWARSNAVTLPTPIVPSVPSIATCAAHEMRQQDLPF